MKNKVNIILFLFFSTLLFACSKEESQVEDFSLLTESVWKVVDIVQTYDGQRIGTAISNEKYKFNNDKTYTRFYEVLTQKGEWRYEETMHRIIFQKKDSIIDSSLETPYETIRGTDFSIPLDWKIISLTKDKLHVELVSDKEIINPKIEYFFEAE